MRYIAQINLLINIDHSLHNLIGHSKNGIIVLSEGVRRIVDDITCKACQLKDERISVIVTRWNEIYAKYMSDKPFSIPAINDFKSFIQKFLETKEVSAGIAANIIGG